jgi:hypothetical protein
VYDPELVAVAVNVAPFAASTIVIFAPGTSAPLGSFTTPRSEVDAVWPNERVTVERIPMSIHPKIDRFTADPPKNFLLCSALAFRPFQMRTGGCVVALRGEGAFEFRLKRIESVAAGLSKWF